MAAAVRKIAEMVVTQMMLFGPLLHLLSMIANQFMN
jgi:hypothetical protein